MECIITNIVIAGMIGALCIILIIEWFKGGI